MKRSTSKQLAEDMAAWRELAGGLHTYLADHPTDRPLIIAILKAWLEQLKKRPRQAGARASAMTLSVQLAVASMNAYVALAEKPRVTKKKRT